MSTLAATEVNVLVTTLSNLKIAERGQDLRLSVAQAKTAAAFQETNNDLVVRLNQTHTLSLQERTLTLQTKEKNDALEAQQTIELETLRAKRDAQAATLLSQQETIAKRQVLTRAITAIGDDLVNCRRLILAHTSRVYQNPVDAMNRMIAQYNQYPNNSIRFFGGRRWEDRGPPFAVAFPHNAAKEEIEKIRNQYPGII